MQGVSIQSISNAGGDKRGTRSSSRGEGAVDTNKSPLPLPPRCVGVMSGMSWVLLSPGALFLVTHHQAFSAAHSASSLPLTHIHEHTHTHTWTSTPPGLCVPWSLTLNRPPRLNTTDRQASVHQDQQPSGENTASYFHLFGSLALFVLWEKENKTMGRVF